jgi:hypothetical protein
MEKYRSATLPLIEPEDPDLYLNPDLLELCELAAPGLQREPATGPVHPTVFTGTAGNKFILLIKNGIIHVEELPCLFSHNWFK